MNVLEPCCYTKQFNRFLYDTDLDVIPVYHSGDIFSAHILDRVGMLAPLGSTLWVVMPTVNAYTVKYIKQVAAMKAFDKTAKAQRPKFAAVNILTSEMNADLESVAPMEGQTVSMAVSQHVGISLIGSTTEDSPEDARSNFRVNECLIVTGSIIQTQQPGLHLVEIHRGRGQKELLVPFLRSHMKVHRK